MSAAAAIDISLGYSHGVHMQPARRQGQGHIQFNSIQFKNRPKGQCTEHNDNRPQTNRTTKPSIGAATNPDPPMSLATRSSQSTVAMRCPRHSYRIS